MKNMHIIAGYLLVKSRDVPGITANNLHFGGVDKLLVTVLREILDQGNTAYRTAVR